MGDESRVKILIARGPKVLKVFESKAGYSEKHERKKGFLKGFELRKYLKNIRKKKKKKGEGASTREKEFVPSAEGHTGGK